MNANRPFLRLFLTASLVLVNTSCASQSPEVAVRTGGQVAGQGANKSAKQRAAQGESLSADPAPPPAPETFRAKAPSSGPELTFQLPDVAERRLTNGLRVLIVAKPEFPVVSINLSSNRGAAAAKPGVVSVAADMLLRGTPTHDAIALSDALGALGAQVGPLAAHDSYGLNAQVLAPRVDELLALLADVAQNASFDANELERVRKSKLTTLQQAKDQPMTLLQMQLSRSLFKAGSPYQNITLGNETSIKSLLSWNLSTFHKAHFAPSCVTLVLSGQITPERAEQLAEKHFGSWRGQCTVVNAPAQSEPANAPGVLLTARKGAPQSALRVATLGVDRQSAVYPVLVLLNTILGGQFSSRLNMNLREKNGYTYGAGSLFDMRHGVGPFSAGGAIMTDKTGPALQEIFGELAKMRDGLVSEEELADAKNYLVRQLPSLFETTADAAQSASLLGVYGLPLDEYRARAAKLRAVTASEIQVAAQKYLAPSRLRTFIVGDPDKVLPQLEAAKIGPVKVVQP